jgi:putative membrane protein
MKTHLILLLIFAVSAIFSFIGCKEVFTWFLECIPAFLGVLILVLTYHSFQFSNLTYYIILAHCLILLIGGHYTYAEVPLFDWIKETFHQSRNNYDKVGHFAQGFVPALIIRELLVRQEVVNGKKWLYFVIVSISLAISAFYELIEWFVSINTGESGDAFLGTQGDIWDTQSDMLTALIGAIAALLLCSKLQDKSIAFLLRKIHSKSPINKLIYH